MMDKAAPGTASRFVFAIAGTQGGKTSYGPWCLWREITKRGAGDYIAVTATFDLFKLKMLPEIRNVFEHVLRIGRYWAGDGMIEIANPQTGKFEAKRADDPMWARIILRSAAAGGGLESATAKAAWLDECGQDAFTIDTWDAVQRRLSIHQGRVFGGTTPYNLGWLKIEIVDKAASDPNIEVISFPSIENPLFPGAEFESRRAKMPTWKFNMFYLYRESLEGDKSTKQHAAGAALKAHMRGERVVMWYVGQSQSCKRGWTGRTLAS